jgi:hypothetical protein
MQAVTAMMATAMGSPTLLHELQQAKMSLPLRFTHTTRPESWFTRGISLVTPACLSIQ